MVYLAQRKLKVGVNRLDCPCAFKAWSQTDRIIIFWKYYDYNCLDYACWCCSSPVQCVLHTPASSVWYLQKLVFRLLEALYIQAFIVQAVVFWIVKCILTTNYARLVVGCSNIEFSNFLGSRLSRLISSSSACCSWRRARSVHRWDWRVCNGHRRKRLHAASSGYCWIDAFCIISRCYVN